MANQLVGVNNVVQLGPPNGPNEPLPPAPPLNNGLFGDAIGDEHELWKDYFLSRGDGHDVPYVLLRKTPASVGNIRQPGAPNWRETDLEPFERNLYREHFRTAWRSPVEVREYREKNGITIVSGRGVPKPLLHTYEANFPASLVEALEANNSATSPTAAQAQCWPIALKGRDLLAVLGAGAEGKTLAYILPAITHVLHQPRKKHHPGFRALVLAPTPEEAREIQRAVSELETYTGVRATCVCSGEPKDRQLRNLRLRF
nr:probable ATP-dependent RNA helicase DDX5 [Rhipicephalus microplus]